MFIHNKKVFLFLFAAVFIILLIFIIAYFLIIPFLPSTKSIDLAIDHLTIRSYSLVKSSYYYTDLELNPKKIALIIIHPWNIGSPNGPAYPEEFAIFMGSKKNTEQANKIMREKLAPVLEWARKKSIKIVYVMTDKVVEEKYSQFRLPLTYLEIPAKRDVDIPFHHKLGDFPDNYGETRNNATHGAGYNTWSGWEDLAISSYISPENGDIVVGDYEGARLDKWLRDNGINTLLYAGFSTDLCVMVNPIGLRDMFRRHYRLILLRDCTMATEYDDTYKSHKVTEISIRYVETYLGSSTIIPISKQK